jgi:flagellar biogenesis protein FliO
MSPIAKYVIETLVTLLGVIALAVLVLYAARRIGVGRPAGPLELVGKLPLDGRRAVYLVRVGKTIYVVGASEAGLSKLGELEDGAIDPALLEAKPSAFSDVLARVIDKSRGRRDPAEPKEKDDAA